MAAVGIPFGKHASATRWTGVRSRSVSQSITRNSVATIWKYQTLNEAPFAYPKPRVGTSPGVCSRRRVWKSGPPIIHGSEHQIPRHSTGQQDTARSELRVKRIVGQGDDVTQLLPRVLLGAIDKGELFAGSPTQLIGPNDAHETLMVARGCGSICASWGASAAARTRLPKGLCGRAACARGRPQ